MDKKKLKWQLAVIGLVILFFAGLDIAIYQLFIKRVISHHSPGMQKMSVEVSDYVPFSGSENIYSVRGEVELEGDLPTIDGAAALLPIYAGFVESIYPEDSVIFNGETFRAPLNWDAVLRPEYGDYLTLPPPEERRPKHFCSLEIPDPDVLAELSEIKMNSGS